jgi:alpha-aminoadipic semialdehyde synthase
MCRYPGFADLMHAFKCIGLLSEAHKVTIDGWASLARVALEARLGSSIKADSASFVSALSDVVPPHQLDDVLKAWTWLSTPPSLPPAPPLPAAHPPIDLFATLLAHKLRYRPHERDLVVLAHEIVVQRPASGSAPPPVEEVYTASLVAYGTPTASAMSRCVGLPVAFAALRVLDGAVPVRGVAGPTDQSIYKYVLEELVRVGLGMKESVRKGEGMERVLLRSLRSSA